MLIPKPFRQGFRLFRYSRILLVEGLDVNGWNGGRNLSTTAVLNVKKVLKQFKLADIGEGITECEVIRWCVMVASVINLL